MTTIAMLKHEKGSQDGIAVQEFVAGEVYDVTPRLAQVFVGLGSAVYATPADELSEIVVADEVPTVLVEDVPALGDNTESVAEEEASPETEGPNPAQLSEDGTLTLPEEIALDSLTVLQLKEIAAQKGITFNVRATKTELIEAIASSVATVVQEALAPTQEEA